MSRLTIIEPYLGQDVCGFPRGGTKHTYMPYELTPCLDLVDDICAKSQCQTCAVVGVKEANSKLTQKVDHS